MPTPATTRNRRSSRLTVSIFSLLFSASYRRRIEKYYRQNRRRGSDEPPPPVPPKKRVEHHGEHRVDAVTPGAQSAKLRELEKEVPTSVLMTPPSATQPEPASHIEPKPHSPPVEPSPPSTSFNPPPPSLPVEPTPPSASFNPPPPPQTVEPRLPSTSFNLPPPPPPVEPPTPLYRSFQTLQHHLLQHLQHELAQLEYRLAALDVHPHDPSADRALLLDQIAHKSGVYTRVAHQLTFWSPSSSSSVRRPSPRERTAWRVWTSAVDDAADDHVVLAAAAAGPAASSTVSATYGTFARLYAVAVGFLMLALAWPM